ncbi:MAG: hypothetical protein PHP22_01995 [Oscillospiraceae bacterium]|nr:hypothetical protein [Oscillospiraceae bacterium]
MKKAFKQINRGAVMLLVLVMGMSIYCIIQSGIDKKTHAELRDIATEFIADSANRVIIPEAMRSSDGSDATAISGLSENYRTVGSGSWSRFYSDNIQIRQFASEWFETALQVQYGMNTYILSSEPKIDEFGRFRTYRDEATLDFTVTDTRRILMPNGEETLSILSFPESLSFIRENDRWVIVQYSSARLADALAGYSE